MKGKPMKDISSRQNSKFKLWQSLLEAKGIKREGHCLVSGPKLLDEILAADSPRVAELLHPSKGSLRHKDLDVPQFRLSGDLFHELDVRGTKSTLAVVEAPELKVYVPAPAQGLEIVAALSDPANLGALIRSAEAFGVRRIILTKECASPFLPKTIAASSGSVFRVPLYSAPPLSDIDLPEAYGLDMDGENLVNLTWPKDVVLVLGEEGLGLPASLKLNRIRIPMSGKIESLNATAAASIALFSYASTHSK